MSPAEAAESLDEPNWPELWSHLQAADDGFETLLRRWREHHFTPIEINGVLKKKMAPSVDGVIALARLGLMPLTRVTERPPGAFEEQVDAHCWFLSQGRAWRVLGIEDRMLCLNSFGEEKQIDLTRAKWDKYCEAAAAALEAQRKAPGAHA
jgi:hypothetical protein